MSPELQEIRSHVERIVARLDAADWRRAPEGKWNCSQILEHLFLTYTATTKGVMRAMEAGRPLGSKPGVGDRIAAFCVVGLGFIPGGRTAPKQATPKDGLEMTGALRDFNNALVALDGILVDAERRFGSKAKVLDHPFIGPLSVRQWRRLHRFHAKHHFKQIDRLLKHT